MTTSIATCAGCGQEHSSEIDDMLAAFSASVLPDGWLRLNWSDEVTGPSPVPPQLHERHYCPSCKRTALEALAKSPGFGKAPPPPEPLFVKPLRKVIFADEYITVSLPRDNPLELARMAESYHRASVAVVREIARIVPAGKEQEAKKIFEGGINQGAVLMESVLNDSFDARKKPS